jgi:hypothetical protein
MVKFRSAEEKRRENFRSEISRYVPEGLVAGMEDDPPHCEITASYLTDRLPILTREDIGGRISPLLLSSHTVLYDTYVGLFQNLKSPSL